MTSTIITIIGSILGVAASLWINSIIKKYIQRYEDAKQENETKKAKDELMEEILRRQRELDKLKEIEDKLP